MPAKKQPTGTDKDLNLASMSALFVDENKARQFIESKRWPDGIPYCPHCGEQGYELKAKPDSKNPVPAGTKKCKGCRKKFTVRIGTIFEESKLPLSKWLLAFHLVTASKKGVSSHQIARQLGCTQKTAWFLCHRIRECMKMEPVASMLSGSVEADECYVGGKPRHKNNPGADPLPRMNGRGRRGMSNKKPVMVLVERGGNSVAFPIAAADAPTLKTAVRNLVDPSSTLFTDDAIMYHGLDKEFAGGHHTVNHSAMEYVRYEQHGGATYVSSNTAESWFAILKRSHYGVHHQMSAKHLHRYCNERSFMWNKRTVTDGERMVAAIEGGEGKRLMYKGPKGLKGA